MLETILQPNDVDERCGVLLTDGSVVEIHNIAPDRALGYEMDPAQLLPYVKAKTIAGTWHTHPDADPNLSGEDYEGFCAWPKLDHYIIGRRDGEVVVRKFQVEDGLIIACD